jgi:hypothetical protein
MKRTRFVSRIKERSAEQGGDPEYLGFIRGLRCCVYGTAAPSHAHHESEAGRGKGQKAPDRRTMPMSFRAHREWHDHTGFCRGWSKLQRRAFQDAEIERCLAMHAEWKATGVLVEPLQKAV